MLSIESASRADFPKLWPIISEVFAKGDTYPCLPATSCEEAKGIWFSPEKRIYMARTGDEIVGTYYLKPNQPGLGDHICNAGYMVSSRARGKGYGKALALHSLEEARKCGYKAIQFNLVVETNAPSLLLWEKLGFTVIGKVPEAFRHPAQGLVGAYILYKKL